MFWAMRLGAVIALLITGGLELGQIGRIAKLFADFAMIELKSKELVRVECKDLQLTAKDGPPRGAFLMKRKFYEKRANIRRTLDLFEGMPH
jgi:hypothetical protein